MALAIVTAIAIVACTPATPETVEVTREVERVVEVEKQVEVEKIVEVEVEKEVQVTRVVEVEVMAPEGPKDTIVFSDLNWTSAQVQNRIAQYIVEHGYGFPTDVIPGGTLPLFQGLKQGDTHVTMEIWLPNQSIWLGGSGRIGRGRFRRQELGWRLAEHVRHTEVRCRCEP